MQKEGTTPPQNTKENVKNEHSEQIIMKSVIEKNEVMSRLGRLKDAVAEFKKISITDDYTREKREEIKIWIMLAKEKNIKEETGYTWKVRGTPKEGLRLALIKH